MALVFSAKLQKSRYIASEAVDIFRTTSLFYLTETYVKLQLTPHEPTYEVDCVNHKALLRFVIASISIHS
jgi:hypothetical protein